MDSFRKWNFQWNKSEGVSDDHYVIFCCSNGGTNMIFTEDDLREYVEGGLKSRFIPSHIMERAYKQHPNTRCGKFKACAVAA